MKRGRLLMAAAMVAAGVSALTGATSPIRAASTPNDGTPAQKYIDVKADANTYAGQWGDVTGGVAGRPYVTDLSVTVTPAGGGTPVSQTYITGGTASTPASVTPGDITMTITPYNVCNPAKGETPGPGKCYTSPNRLGALIGYVKNDFNVGTNFSNPTDGSGNVITNQMLDLIKNPANTTVFDVKLNMSMWGQNLRWTWLNGLPAYWNVSPIGENNSVVHLKFQLQTGPSELCDTRIPVEGCDPTQRGANFAPSKILTTNFVLSLDDTGVDQIFAGALFASSNADMGSLEAKPIGSPVLGLTYGVSGTNELGGEANSAKFWAFVSDSSLINYFGTNQETLDSADFATSETLSVTRADGGTSESTSWARWTADANGTPGYFLTVNGVRFDGKAVAAAGVRSAAQAVTKPAKWTMGNKSGNTVRITRFGAKQRVSMSASGSTCKKNLCRWIVSTSSSKVSASLKRLATVPTVRGTSRATTVVRAKKGDLVSALLQVKKGGKWTFVTSRMVVGQ